MKYKIHRGKTTLSGHVCNLKEEGKQFKLTYKCIARAKPYNPASGRCNIYLKEKTIIISRPHFDSLNKQNKHTSKCRHRDKYLLSNI